MTIAPISTNVPPIPMNVATCINTIGSYECVCWPGYEENGCECANIDEFLVHMLELVFISNMTKKFLV